MIELMVVVVIVGILAAIAIPIYGKYIKNARVTEATGRIGEIVTASKAWAQDHQDAGTGNPDLAESGTVGSWTCHATRELHLCDYRRWRDGRDRESPGDHGHRDQQDERGHGRSVNIPDINSNGDAPDITGL